MENTTQPPNITIQDLTTIHSLIDVACTRGAFRAEEASKVGEMYDKLTAFLNAVFAQAKEAEEQSSDQGENNND